MGCDLQHQLHITHSLRSGWWDIFILQKKKKKSFYIGGQKTKVLQNRNSICAAKAALGTMLYFVTGQKTENSDWFPLGLFPGLLQSISPHSRYFWVSDNLLRRIIAYKIDCFWPNLSPDVHVMTQINCTTYSATCSPNNLWKKKEKDMWKSKLTNMKTQLQHIEFKSQEMLFSLLLYMGWSNPAKTDKRPLMTYCHERKETDYCNSMFSTQLLCLGVLSTN